jgi:hypothetical protein
MAALAKLTSKNQLTLPKTVVDAVVAAAGVTEYFDVEVRSGQIVLTPVRLQRGDAVRAKLDALGLTEADVADAVAWARGGGSGFRIQEPAPSYVAQPPVSAPGEAPTTKPASARRTRKASKTKSRG